MRMVFSPLAGALTKPPRHRWREQTKVSEQDHAIRSCWFDVLNRGDHTKTSLDK
jgi:hypothetical protein